jgi:hypothetical protein
MSDVRRAVMELLTLEHLMEWALMGLAAMWMLERYTDWRRK